MENIKEERKKELQTLIEDIQKKKADLNEKIDEYYSEVRKLDDEIFKENNQKYIGRCFRWDGSSMRGSLSEAFIYKIMGPIEKDKAQNCLAVFEDGIKVVKIRCFEPVKMRLMVTNENKDDTFVKSSTEITEEEFKKVFDDCMNRLNEMVRLVND